MKSDFLAHYPDYTLSDYLEGLTAKWSTLTNPSANPSFWSGVWTAISGSYTNSPLRLVGNYGCPPIDPNSDGVVCDESARYLPAVTSPPTIKEWATQQVPKNGPWYNFNMQETKNRSGSPNIAHATIVILGFPSTSGAELLYNPIYHGDLLNKVVAQITTPN
jgi:hypothetical protein